MKKIISIIILAIVFLSTACEENNFKIYTDGANIQFGPEESRIYMASYNLVDTTKAYTFYYKSANVVQDTVFFDIYAIGGVSAINRSFTLKQDSVTGVTNAVAGVDYIAFDDSRVKDNYVIKAGTVHTRVPVILLRNEKLKTNTLTLKISTVANENFRLGEKTNIWRKIIFTDRLSQPNSWDANTTKYYFGSYSVAKHAFMIQATGDKWDDVFFGVLKSDYSLMSFYTSFLKTSLIDYNNAHPTSLLKDENGVLVTFP
jgi:hypothetical protein